MWVHNNNNQHRVDLASRLNLLETTIFLLQTHETTTLHLAIADAAKVRQARGVARRAAPSNVIYVCHARHTHPHLILTIN